MSLNFHFFGSEECSAYHESTTAFASWWRWVLSPLRIAEFRLLPFRGMSELGSCAMPDASVFADLSSCALEVSEG